MYQHTYAGPPKDVWFPNAEKIEPINTYSANPSTEWFPSAEKVHLNDTLTKIKFGKFPFSAFPGDVKLVGLHHLPFDGRYAEMILDACFEQLFETVGPIAALTPLFNGFEFRIIPPKEPNNEIEDSSSSQVVRYRGEVFLEVFHDEKWAAAGVVNYVVRGSEIYHECKLDSSPFNSQ